MTGPVAASQLGWVLRNARECAEDRDLRTRAGMATTLGVHRSQVGRWEGGHLPLHERRVHGYEAALGLAPSTLVCALDIVNRDRTPVRGGPTVAIEAPEDAVPELVDLLERALSDEVLTGGEWLRLSGLLDACPDVVLRRDDWRALVRRALLEMAVTHGLENSLRWEASARMVAHPRSGGVAAQLAAEALDDHDQQLFADYTALVQYSPDPSNLSVLLDRLARDLPDGRLWAVLLALATYAGRTATRPRLVPSVPRLLDLVRDEARSLRVRRAAAGVLAAVDPATSRRLTAALSGRETRAARLLHQGSSGTSSHQRQVMREVASALSERELPFDDPVFRRLLARASAGADEDARGNALAVLVLTAQGPVVGRVFGRRLADAVGSDEESLVAEYLSVLCWLAQPADLPLLTDLATSASPEAALAGYALGNCVEPPGPARSSRDRALLAAATSGRGAPGGVTYALALRGRFDLVERVRRSSRREGRSEWESAARWWLGLPGPVRRLAVQQSTGTAG